MRSLFFGILFFASIAQAEYRAFKLRIEKVNNPAEAKEIMSTLDPLQYPGYFPLQADEKISYVRTWMCYGRTNGKPICPDPEAPQPTAESAPVN